MPDADDRLRALFAQDAPPARDPAFSAAVMHEIARRRFLLDVALLAGATALGGLVLWALWPMLEPLVTTLSRELAPAVGCLAVALAAVAILDRPVAGPAGFHS